VLVRTLSGREPGGGGGEREGRGKRGGRYLAQRRGYRRIAGAIILPELGGGYFRKSNLRFFFASPAPIFSSRATERSRIPLEARRALFFPIDRYLHARPEAGRPRALLELCRDEDTPPGRTGGVCPRRE